MKHVKNFVISFSLSIVLLISLCTVILCGLTLAKNSKLGRYITAVQIRNEENIGSVLAETIYDKIGNKDYDSVAEMSELYRFKYSVSWAFTASLIGNSEIKELVEAGAEKHVFREENSYLVIYILMEDMETPDNIIVFRLANYLGEHTSIVIIAGIISLFLLVLSCVSLIVYASTVYKLIFAVLTAGAIEFAAVYYFVGINQKSILSIIALEKAILLLVVLYYWFHFHRLQQKVSDIGGTSAFVATGTKWFPYSMKEMASDIDIAGSNMFKAVEEKIKSERLKAELISNVSHDIKTPLTSIINFSDLICSEKTENENITKFSKLLHEQSLRMKALLEELIEASKVSAGAIDINLVPCNVQTLLEQSVVEYESKLKEKNIILSDISLNETVYINADVIALSRVFDNLLTNIVKYAAEGSTAYIEPEIIGNEVAISFKNVPKEPIRISADELTERFVRGDTSRHSEGHGLGLSIVYDLMELMGAKLVLSANSVMFEAKLLFDITEYEAMKSQAEDDSSENCYDS